MRQTIRICISIIFFALNHFTLKAQIFFPPLSCIVDASGTCIPNPILTAVPYLKLSTDAALSGMGESSMLVSPNANTIYSNAALMTNAKNNSSLAVNHLGMGSADDLGSSVLVGISGFHKFSKTNALGIGIRYLDIKNHEYTDATGQFLGINKPNDFDLTIAYAKQINSKFSASISSRYIASNVLTGFVLNSIEIQTAHTFAFDLGLSYMTGIKLAGYDGKIIYGFQMSYQLHCLPI